MIPIADHIAGFNLQSCNLALGVKEVELETCKKVITSLTLTFIGFDGKYNI